VLVACPLEFRFGMSFRKAAGTEESRTALRICVPKAPWSAAARRRLGITAKGEVTHRAGLTLPCSSLEKAQLARYEGGVEPPHSKALRACSGFLGARQRADIRDIRTLLKGKTPKRRSTSN
jgi:hypothetical protein